MEITISEPSTTIVRKGWYCPDSAMFGSSNRQNSDGEDDFFRIRQCSVWEGDITQRVILLRRFYCEAAAKLVKCKAIVEYQLPFSQW